MEANANIGERVGCTFLVAKTVEIAENCESVMERLQRSEVSNPPAFGAKVASLILNDDQLIEMWYADLVTMCSRIRQMREALYSSLVEKGSFIFVTWLSRKRLTSVGAPGKWNHVVNQSGMFSFLGLPYDIVIKLRGMCELGNG